MRAALDTPTLTALPQGICSWQYKVFDENGAEIADFNVQSSYAVLNFQGLAYYLLVSGQLFHFRFLWVRDDGRIATQRFWVRPTVSEVEYPALAVFTRSPGLYFGTRFDVEIGGEAYHLKSSNGLFIISRNGKEIGMVRRQHAFTRRALVLFDPGISQLTQLLFLGKVLATWRTDADTSAS